MKRLLYLFTVLALSAAVAGPVMAQDNPFLGTWKLNTAKSKFVGMSAPKSATRTVTAAGSGAKYSFDGVAADGSAISYSFTSNYDDKDEAVTGNGMPGGADTISLKRAGTHKSEAVLKKGGKEIAKSTAEVSKDGKVTTIKIKGKDADGKEWSGDSVYEKQ